MLFNFFTRKIMSIRSRKHSLRPGDEIITVGGIHGIVDEVRKDSVVFHMPGDDVRIQGKLWALSSVVGKDEL